jgi:hypothetical protein
LSALALEEAFLRVFAAIFSGSRRHGHSSAAAFNLLDDLMNFLNASGPDRQILTRIDIWARVPVRGTEQDYYAE